MKTPLQPLNLTIPVFIRAIPGLTFTDQVVLAHLAEHPRSYNGQLARLTGLTDRGIEALIRRLCKRGHLLKVSEDGSRRFVVPAAAATHTECGNVLKAESHIPCGPGVITASAAPSTRTTAMAVKEWPLEDFLRFESRIADDLFGWGQWHHARHHYQRCMERIAKEEGLDEETRSGALAELKQKTDVLFALEHLVPPKGSASDRDRCKIGSVIFRAPAERLAEFRRRVEGGAVLLGPAVEVLALARPDEAVSLSSANPAPRPTRPQPQNPAPDATCDRGDGQSD